MKPVDRPIYVIHLRPDHDDASKIRRGLNWLLKRAGRNYGLKCVKLDLLPIQDGEQPCP